MDRDLQKLVEDYRPNTKVLNELGKISFLGVVGATSSGKTTLIDMLTSRHPGFKKVISETSRPKRTDSTEAEEYIFRDRQEMIEDIKAGRMVQIALNPTGELYGTRPEDYPTDGTGVMSPMSQVVSIFRSLPFRNVNMAFIVPKSFNDWQIWLKKRPLLPDELSKRLKEAKQSYEFALSDSKIKFALNDDLDRTVGRLLQVSQNEVPDDETSARKIAEDNYRQLLRQPGIE